MAIRLARTVEKMMLRRVLLFIATFAMLISTGCHRQPRTIDQAIVATGAPEKKLRVKAVFALGDLCKKEGNTPSSNRGVAVLEEKLGDPEPDVRCAAACALGELGPLAARSLRLLTALADDQDSGVRISATYGICSIAESNMGLPPSDVRVVTECLLKRFNDDNSVVRAHAIRGCVALALSDEGVLRAIAAMTRDPDPGIRRRALEALASAGVRAKAYVHLIRPLLSDEDSTVRRLAANLLSVLEPSGEPNAQPKR